MIATKTRRDPTSGRPEPCVGAAPDAPPGVAPTSNALTGAPPERLARYLSREFGDVTTVLNDRRVPGTKAHIDHVVVTAGGIWVIDAKNYRGQVVGRALGGAPSPSCGACASSTPSGRGSPGRSG